MEVDVMALKGLPFSEYQIGGELCFYDDSRECVSKIQTLHVT